MKKERYFIPHKSDDYYYDEFFIQKRKGKKRRVCAPSPLLKAAQRAQMQELYNVYYNQANTLNVSDNIHGFLPNRNIVTAAEKHIGYQTTIQMDISNCFDSIFMFSTRVPDNTLFQHEDGSLAQGFVTSPILANIYLTIVIHAIKLELDQLDEEYAITSYADDLAISINTDDYNIINLIPIIVTEVMEKYKLTINPGKTRIRYAKYGNRKILGIMVGETSLNPSRRLKGKIRAARHQKNGSSLGGLVTASRMLLPKALRPI